MDKLETTLAVGGKANSLGKVNDVIDAVLKDKSLLAELYSCMFSQDAWVRMRAADAFEKICRQHPEWIEPYIDRIQTELSDPSQQASIQWHIAQIYQQVHLSEDQKRRALAWLAQVLSSSDIDWIVSANAMKSLAYFTKRGDFAKEDLRRLLIVQTHHKSATVVKKANQFIADSK